MKPSPAVPAVPDGLRDAVNALLHQIEIGDFVDSNGHSAKMLKPVHDLMRLISESAAPAVPDVWTPEELEAAKQRAKDAAPWLLHNAPSAPAVREPLHAWEFVAMWATAAEKHDVTHDIVVEFGRAVEARCAAAPAVRAPLADRLPLPPADHAYNSGSFAPLWGEQKMHSHAAAASAAYNAALRAANTDLNNALMAESLSAEGLADAQAYLMTEVKGLRARLELHDACNGTMTGEPPRYAPECVALRADNTRLQNEVVGPLRERVNVLEDALQRYVNHDLLTGTRGKMNEIARAALGDNDADPG